MTTSARPLYRRAAATMIQRPPLPNNLWGNVWFALWLEARYSYFTPREQEMLTRRRWFMRHTQRLAWEWCNEIVQGDAAPWSQ
jgi:hypothetical protein